MQTITIKRILPVLLILWANTFAGAVDLDRLFPQVIDSSFFSQLQKHKGCERAVFVDLASKEKVFYLRYVDKKYILRTNLNEEEESLLEPSVLATDRTLFSPLKQNGEHLYQKGSACTGRILNASACEGQFTYIPFKADKAENDAFISDLGYLEITMIPKSTIGKSELEKLLQKLFGKHAQICQQIKLNRYYLFRDNYYGPVGYVSDQTSENIIFPPVHKATLYKGLSDNVLKAVKDRQLAINLIASDKFLYSQDMRLKLGMVPGFVKINWRLLDNTDIGSGQNHLVFLSVGPGINYFDDPWQSTRKNVPCPRLFFHCDLTNLARIQIYPTYSIEPEAKGTGRLTSINNFQQCDITDTNRQNQVIWSSADFKKQMLPAIEEMLCRYGLTNDDEDLTPGFELEKRYFKGNPVNNELRLLQFAAVKDYLISVIVPAQSAKSYRQAYHNKMANTSRHWEYNCGIHYHKLFAETAESNDKGFRVTWLMLQVKKSNPTLFRILKRAQQSNKTNAMNKIADKISLMACRAGRDFFLTPYFRQYRNLDQQRTSLWLNYLEACRGNEEKKADMLFSQYVSFYKTLEKACEEP